MRIVLELIALADQQKLRKPDLVDVIRQFSTRTGEGHGATLNQFLRPTEVIGAVVLDL